MGNKASKKTSISKKFISLMRMFIVWFVICSAILLVTLNFLNGSYVSKRDELRDKQKMAEEINHSFDQALFDVRGYIAYGNISLKNNALSEEPKINRLKDQFQKHASTKEDKLLVQNINHFSQYYFKETLPKVLAAYKSGDKTYVTAIANSQGTTKVIQFRNDMEDYLQRLNEELENHYKKLIKIQTYIQIFFVLFILLILIMLVRIIRVMLRQIGQPLSVFANAAEKMANGEHANIRMDEKRDDEIGALSSAFQKMVINIQEKEYALRNRNLELNTLYHQSEEERKRNQKILDSLQEGVQLINQKGITLQINKKLCELIPCTGHSFVGMDWGQWTDYMLEHVEEHDFAGNSKKIMENIHRLEVNDYSFIYTLKNPRRVIKVYYEGLYEGEEGVGMVLVHRDITKEFEVDQMKSEFVSTVSHELRTPLASILGFTELLLQRELKPERKEKYLTTILNEAKRLTMLINDFLDIQRMESGKQTYEKKFIELFPMIEKIIEVQQINTNHHHITLESSLSNPVILGDKGKLEQVFTNLISNAIKYSPEGGPISVKISQSDEQVHISIADAGLGIPKNSIDKLFTKFYRIDNSDRRKIGGTGLGLAIVQEIVKAHNGEIIVESEYGKGSTFTTIFPAVKTVQELVQTEGSKGNGFKIVIVEDDQNLAELICQELWDSGFSTTIFKNGLDTMEYLEEEIPDAIVLDILLEDETYDGWRIMTEVKQTERLRNIPIIISTALDEKEKGLSLGAMDFLVKPYQPSHLSKAIMQTILKVGKVGQILIPEKTDELD